MRSAAITIPEETHGSVTNPDAIDMEMTVLLLHNESITFDAATFFAVVALEKTAQFVVVPVLRRGDVELKMLNRTIPRAGEE